MTDTLFSLREGAVVVRVEPGSRRTIEDVAAQITPGAVVVVSVPERDQYQSEHTVSADDVHIK